MSLMHLLRKQRLKKYLLIAHYYKVTFSSVVKEQIRETAASESFISIMEILSDSNLTNTTNNIVRNSTMENKTEGSVQLEFIFTVGAIIINSISCPFTVLLNVLVIMAVKKRPSLQSNTNILLSCLAVTDLLTGLIVQPSFVAWKSFYVLKNVNVTAFVEVQNYFLRFLTISSSLHLMLATCERLLAVKYTNYYSYIVMGQKAKH